MDITKLKQLCVPVSERLPEKCKWVICFNEFHEDPPMMSLPLNKFDYYDVTHWLDPELLTTKKAAIELARQAYDDGVCYENDGDVDEWITQNENKL